MSDPAAELHNHQPKHEYLICIDSDGCAFDSMEIKHKECFIPNFIKYFELQPVAKFARTAWEFVNLYSKWRGVNRFPALTKTLDLLGEWDQVQMRNVVMPELPNLRQWIETESKLGNPALEAYCQAHPDQADCLQTFEWSKAVNATVADLVHNLPPFPHVRDVLEKAQDKADLLVCSATPQATLIEEWQRYDIDQFVFSIAGQEQGKKSEHIEYASKGKYDPSKVIMIGDAPGDLKAAKANNALFYPINPGAEEASWARLHDEVLEKFFSGAYAGNTEASAIAEFEALLPEVPPWK
jgi:phosphoglycolate phosphatase-like HAD superfamily hydrolase